jgi:hypothetical protein
MSARERPLILPEPVRDEKIGLSSRVFLWTWGGCLALGLLAMVRYEATPAPTARASDLWPDVSSLDRDPFRPTVMMFVHPRCPCSRASLAELNILASDCGSALAVRIIFVRPEGLPEEWERTDLWRAAQGVPGAILLVDRDGVEAARFRARVSGETFLYAADGWLLFQGGITAARGHEGDNQGLTALKSLVLAGRAELARAPVYGCSLFHPRETSFESSKHATDEPDSR